MPIAGTGNEAVPIVNNDKKSNRPKSTDMGLTEDVRLLRGRRLTGEPIFPNP